MCVLRVQIQITKIKFATLCNGNIMHTVEILTFSECICATCNERKSEQAHIPHAPTLLENAVYNEWQFQALVTGNLTKKGT